MNILFLTKEFPYPPDSGARMRSFHIINRLAKEHNLTLLCFGDVGDEWVGERLRAVETVKENSQPSRFVNLFSVLPFAVRRKDSIKMKKKLMELLKKGDFDLFICDGLHQAVNVPFEVIPRHTKKVLFEHNVESVIVKRYMDSEYNIAKKLYAAVEYFKMRRFESNMWRNFGSCVVCSKVDKEMVRKRLPNLNISVVSNGIDMDSFKGREEEVEPFSIVYTGEMGWFPNEDAVVYFAKEIYPLIKRKAPSAKFYIVGRNPSARVRGLSRLDESIVVTGTVQDVREYIYRAEVFVAPIRIGSGTRLKILEAMAIGKPVVSTSVGCEGLEVEDAENILIADIPGEFAQKTLELFRNKELREKLIQGARKVIEERYDWKIIYKELEGCINGDDN